MGSRTFYGVAMQAGHWFDLRKVLFCRKNWGDICILGEWARSRAREVVVVVILGRCWPHDSGPGRSCTVSSKSGPLCVGGSRKRCLGSFSWGPWT